MRVNILTERKNAGWILRRAAEELEPIDGVQINKANDADIVYYVNYALYHEYIKGIRVGHFTHLEEDGHWRNTFLETIPKCDYYTCTCDITKNILLKHGAENDKIFVIPYGTDDRVKKDIIKFGVIGRTYQTGRKGERLVKEMVKNGFMVYSWGSGWGCPEIYNTWDELPKFYDFIDYLVVTSTNEGGPVPVIDAIAAGVPVIAPDVGWCWEYPVIKYNKGDWQSLKHILLKLTNPPTWKEWARKHDEMFKWILKRS